MSCAAWYEPLFSSLCTLSLFCPQDHLASTMKDLPLTRLYLIVDVRNVHLPPRDLFEIETWRLHRGRQVSPLSHPAPFNIDEPPILSGRCVAQRTAALFNVSSFTDALCATIPTLVDTFVCMVRQTPEIDYVACSSHGANVSWSRGPGSAEWPPNIWLNLTEGWIFGVDLY